MGIFIPQAVARRALERCVPGAGGCLISTYSRGSHGYAQVGWRNRELGKRHMTTAHRAAWVAANGLQIPEGMTVDHTCHTRPCVNPAHLRLLSNIDNARDNGQVRTNPSTDRMWRCGHEIALSSTGRGYCRECNNAHRKKQRQRQTSPT